jgi:hypothetical protein
MRSPCQIAFPEAEYTAWRVVPHSIERHGGGLPAPGSSVSGGSVFWDGRLPKSIVGAAPDRTIHQAFE